MFLSKFIVLYEPDKTRLAVATSRCLNTCWADVLFSGVLMNKNVCGAIHRFCTVCGLRASITVQSHQGPFSGSVLCSFLMIAADIQFAAQAPTLCLLAVLVLSATHH